MFDKDGDGTVSLEEFKSVLKTFGLSDDQGGDLKAEELFRKNDLNGNGSIDFSEFLMMTANQIDTSEAEEDIREAFKFIDTNGDGKISKNELRHVIGIVDPTLSQQEIDMMLAEADTDRDGDVSYEEFLSYVMKDCVDRSEKLERYLSRSRSTEIDNPFGMKR